MSVQEQLWTSFREDPAGDQFHPEAHVVFLPTGAGAVGSTLIRQFYARAFRNPAELTVDEKVIHRTIGATSAVDEVEVTVKFVSGSGAWLLPGIQPHHLEDLVLTFPMVVTASFHEETIASVRYYWDNAAVLKLARLIGSRHSWPIVETQADALSNPTRFRMNPFGNPSSAAGARAPGGQISNIFGGNRANASEQITSNVAASPNAPARKGHPALTSTVFSHLKTPAEPATTEPRDVPVAAAGAYNSTNNSTPASSPPTKKGHPALTSTLFNHLKNAPMADQGTEARSRVKSAEASIPSSGFVSPPTSPPTTGKKGHPALTSTLFNHLKEAPVDQQTNQRAVRPVAEPEPVAVHATLQESALGQEPPAAGWRADRVIVKGHPALTSTLFNQPAPAPVVVKPYKKTGHNIFGDPDAPPQTYVPVTKKALSSSPAPPTPMSPMSPSTSQPALNTIDLTGAAVALEDLSITPSTSELSLLAEGEHQVVAVEEEEQQEEQMPVVEKVEAPVPASPPAKVTRSISNVFNQSMEPTSAATQQAKKAHPNYRSQISIGGF